MALITIDNHDPRCDIHGRIVDAHDGSLEYYEGRFYWYGTAYGDADGFTDTNHFAVYSSPDLRAWTPHGDILPERPEGVYFRPYVRHCARTGMYVLWYNWYPELWRGRLGVAVSAHPQGPFKIVREQASLCQPGPGDLGLFVDDDETGYLIYTSVDDDHAVSIERLTEDYCSSTLESSGILSRGDEACALFKRGAVYYALFDATCCFCPQGSGIKVHTSASPLGPYTFRGNINCRDTPCGSVPIVNAQQAHVARFPTADGDIYVWTGDRWGSRLDGIKGHDFQFWSRPLVFNDDGTIQPISWVNEWSFDLKDSS